MHNHRRIQDSLLTSKCPCFIHNHLYCAAMYLPAAQMFFISKSVIPYKTHWNMATAINKEEASPII